MTDVLGQPASLWQGTLQAGPEADRLAGMDKPDSQTRPPSGEKIKKRLMNKALHYLARYASTRARLEDVLLRFARRKLELADPDLVRRLIADVIDEAEQLGYINEAVFASQKVRAGRLAGRSGRALGQKLLQAGLTKEQIGAAITEQAAGQENAELAAALVYARKRRLGPYASAPDRPDPNWQQREIARLARAGFSWDICQQVLGLEDRVSADICYAAASGLPEGDALG